jgi:hypothetical protein
LETALTSKGHTMQLSLRQRRNGRLPRPSNKKRFVTSTPRLQDCVQERNPMMDPFKLMARLALASFKITGYFLACLAQSLWYIAHGKRELIGDAIGYFGRDVTNALADIFRDR